MLISANRVLTKFDCPVEPVASTVSLGFDIDNNQIEGEFQVTSFLRFETTPPNGYTLIGNDLLRNIYIVYIVS